MQLRVNEARKNSFNKNIESLDKTSIGEQTKKAQKNGRKFLEKFIV